LSKPRANLKGIYFDITLNGTKSVLLSLHNVDSSSRSTPDGLKMPSIQAGHMTGANANPISLLVRIDDNGEYIILPSASSIVPLRKDDLDVNLKHDIRVIAPMVSRNTIETLQLEGIWIDENGQLLPHDPGPTISGSNYLSTFSKFPV
jgi:hypothetical protein